MKYVNRSIQIISIISSNCVTHVRPTVRGQRLLQDGLEVVWSRKSAQSESNFRDAGAPITHEQPPKSHTRSLWRTDRPTDIIMTVFRSVPTTLNETELTDDTLDYHCQYAVVSRQCHRWIVASRYFCARNKICNGVFLPTVYKRQMVCYSFRIHKCTIFTQIINLHNFFVISWVLTVIKILIRVF
jgi:hypothetical protein